MILLDPQARPIIAHRGASATHPENSMAAFRAGVSAGSDAFELDVRLSRDGVPVVIHDDSVDRTMNASGPVGRFTADELGRMEGGGGGVPRLSDVLEEFPQVPILVEVKERGASEKTAEVIRAAEARARVVVGAFEHRILRPLRGKGVARLASRREAGAFWALSRVGVAPPARGYLGFSLPERRGALHVVDRRFLRLARRCALPVHVWTVDDVADARRLWSFGVNGLVTNDPARLVAVRETGDV